MKYSFLWNTVYIWIFHFSSQNLSSDGQTLEVKAAIHKAAVGGAEFLKSLEELLKAADISINIVNNYGRFIRPTDKAA